nr:DUF3265 domain-containing protein [uncultured Vibrio sp.]
MTPKHLRVIPNAWYCWFTVGLVFKVKCGGLVIELLAP